MSSSFIAIAPSSTPPAPNPSGTIQNDGWFPDIPLNEARESLRTDGTVTDTRLRDALVAAIIQVNTELAAWKVGRIAAGATDLNSDGDHIGGRSIRATLYRQAVFRLAHADLTERYRDFDSTKSGTDTAEKTDPTADDDRRAARWALNDLKSTPRTTIELI